MNMFEHENRANQEYLDVRVTTSMSASFGPTTNNQSSDSSKRNSSSNLSIFAIDQNRLMSDDFGLFNDDGSEHKLTLLDLQPNRVMDHNLSVFDELAAQCNAVLHENDDESTKKPWPTVMSSLISADKMMNDYELRFQRSLQKLMIPSWFIEHASSSKQSDKPLLASITHPNRMPDRTPEIIHVRRPQTTRSCLSSLATSPSPSLHSWHPNPIINPMTCSATSPSSSVTRQNQKYEKGIDRVTKSSHWYRPTQFDAKVSNKSKSSFSKNTIKSSIENGKIACKHRTNNRNEFSSNINQSSPPKSQVSKIDPSNHQSANFGGISDVRTTTINTQNNNRSLTKDKLTVISKTLNESPSMPLENEAMSYGRVELEEITDDEDPEKCASIKKISQSSVVGKIEDKPNDGLLEQLAKDLVDSILVDVLRTVNGPEDVNLGVRELSDDENELRELDENDINGTDEFILFPTQTNEDDDETDRQSPSQVRGSLNRLYTFARISDDSTNSNKNINNQRESPSLPPSVLIIDDKDNISTNNEILEQPIDSATMNTDPSSLPIYRSHIQKRNINLGRYYDGMMRGNLSQLPTHDLRPNLLLTKSNIVTTDCGSSEGITEETVRQGRLLLDSIPTIVNEKNVNDPLPILNQDVPVRSILKNTRSVVSHQKDQHKKLQETDDHTRIIIEERKKSLSPRRVVTTLITEEYCRVKRQIIEEFSEEPPEEPYSTIKNTNDRGLETSVSHAESSIYESLSDCYSGFTAIRSDVKSNIKLPNISNNVSSIPSTTDEAYESDPTTSGRSPTISSSTALTTSHIHPNLVHEFEYPSPAPPVPDRRLKPPHLRPAPSVRPRTRKSRLTESNAYSSIKRPTSSPLTLIQNLVPSTTDSNSSARTMSSRHYCGSLPIENDSNKPLDQATIKINVDQTTEKRHSRTMNYLHTNPDEKQQQDIVFSKGFSTKIRSKRSSTTYYDETVNGLAIRLPNSTETCSESMFKSNQSRDSTQASIKPTDRTIKYRNLTEQSNSDPSSIYETSV